MSFCRPTMVKTSLRLISAYSETQEKYEKKKMTEQLKPLPGASIVDVGVQFESGDRISKTCGAKVDKSKAYYYFTLNPFPNQQL
nr:hypothetical protein Iba_chr06bCG6230 [Ipomoea batatas]GMD68376.1 hypothetical protein Iba_scaffold50005CG0010 [Ipomoea batatas]GMD78467.1 hypothetical protein Iba_chr13cCG13300 [Ipomoea batatas]GME09022.1 hypothetical protein Iba_scaffold8096CG0010 [Ipomoea batatas]